MVTEESQRQDKAVQRATLLPCTERKSYLQCDQSSQAKVGGADLRKKFIGKNSKTP